MLHAQQNTDELRDLTRNPVGDAIKLLFVESINFAAGPYDRTSNSLQAPHEFGATDPTLFLAANVPQCRLNDCR